MLKSVYSKIIYIFILLFLCGCKVSYDGDVVYATGNSPSLANKYQMEGPYILDIDASASIASAVFESWQEKGFFQGYVLKECTYYENHQCWLFRYGPEKVLPSSELYIQIMQDTGEIKMWVV